MPTYEVELGGKRYEVEAPSPEAAYEAWNKRQGGGKALPPAMQHPKDMTAAEQFKTGFFDPFVGVEELARHTVGDPAFEGAVQERNADIAKRMPPGFSLPRAAGAAVNPINLIGAGRAATAGSRILGGMASGAVAGATEPTSGGDDYWREKARQTVIGGGGGAALGVAGNVVAGAGRALTPFPVSPRRQQHINTLRNEGIEPTAGQQSGSRFLRYMESHVGDLPGAGGEDVYNRVSEQFTRAALQRAGINSDRITTDAMDRGFRDNSARFNRLALGTEMHGDRQLAQDLHTTLQEYWSQTQPSMRKPYIDNTIMEVADAIIANNNRLDGRTYQSLASRVRRYERETTDPEYKRALGGIRAALDDAMERSIQSTNPNMLGQWREVRRQYRNLLVIEQASTGGSAASKEELLSPAALRRAIVGQNRRDYARGHGDFADLVRAGEEVLTPLPQSGTAPRHATEHPIRSYAMGSTVGRALMSPRGQGYLKNQLWNRPVPNAIPGALPALAPAAGAAMGQQDPLAPPEDALAR